MGNDNFNIKFKDYLEQCKHNNNVKCAIIATDKQCAIYTASKDEENNSHNDLAGIIENMIHINTSENGCDMFKLHDAYIFLEGPEMIANLPLDGNLSLNQAGFLIDILSEICRFNLENDDLISISIFSSVDIKEYRSHDLKRIAKYVLSFITKEYTTEAERIIGKTIFTNNLIEETIQKQRKTL